MPDSADDDRMAENLRRAMELTELTLALRAAALRKQNPTGDAMKQVMHEIRLEKERAWRNQTDGIKP